MGERNWPGLAAELAGFAADDEFGLNLEEARTLLGIMHDETGWDWDIELTAHSHVQWNAKVRVTPRPFTDGESDRSLVTMRVGPPEWALTRAVADMLTWLAVIAPPDAERCFACDAPRSDSAEEEDPRSGEEETA